MLRKFHYCCTYMFIVSLCLCYKFLFYFLPFINLDQQGKWFTKNQIKQKFPLGSPNECSGYHFSPRRGGISLATHGTKGTLLDHLGIIQIHLELLIIVWMGSNIGTYLYFYTYGLGLSHS